MTMGRSFSEPYIYQPKKTSGAGKLALSSIPGYTGYVAGRSAENVFGATHKEANFFADDACFRRWNPTSDRPHNRRPPGSIDGPGGCINAFYNGARGDPGPPIEVLSRFQNMRGHGHRRGAAVPGYVGYIPGKYAGNIHGNTVARDNIEATGTRRRDADDPVHATHRLEVDWNPSSFTIGCWTDMAGAHRRPQLSWERAQHWKGDLAQASQTLRPDSCARRTSSVPDHGRWNMWESAEFQNKMRNCHQQDN